MSCARWTSLGRRRLVAALARPGVSLRVLARGAHVTVAAMSALACGVHRYPSLRVAFALAKNPAIDPGDWLIDNRLEGSRTVSTPVDGRGAIPDENDKAAE